MSIWIIIWALLSITLIAFVSWNLTVLIKQKAVWKAFAAKNKLRYKGRKFMDAPEMDGVLDEYKVSFFPSEHESDDIKGTRNLTAMEYTLNSVLPGEGVVASAGMVPIAKTLGFKAEFVPSSEAWNSEYIAVTDNKNVMAAYLTPERVDVLSRMMKIKNAWVILVSLHDVLMLRVDIASPMASEDEIQKMHKRMITACKILELKSGESKRLKSEKTLSEAKDVALDIDDDKIASIGLELEEDEPDSKADSKAKTPDAKPDTKPSADEKPAKD